LRWQWWFLFFSPFFCQSHWILQYLGLLSSLIVGLRVMGWGLQPVSESIPDCDTFLDSLAWNTRQHFTAYRLGSIISSKEFKWCEKQVHVSSAKIASCYVKYIPISHGYRFNWKSTSLSKNVPTLATAFFITCLNCQWFHVPNVTYI
jgi:hypothetical protein